MLYEITVPAFIKSLGNLQKILDKAAAFADAKKIAPEVLLQSRLAPDMFPLIRQIQIACDTTKLGAARLTGKEAPTHDDKEVTLADVKTRIDSVVSYLKTFKPEDFKGGEERKISQPRWEGKWLTGTEYTLHHVLPNLYFHL
ncbi:MAG: DUF1993 domain-containing protein, partial [Proteobacteria bacterium]|nr:DUF1993 domain-containing protein [Pseudomonadota bacterium]